MCGAATALRKGWTARAWSDRIDSLDFVENLPLLQYLEITDNSVTSLKPLEALPDFQMVWCGKNTIGGRNLDLVEGIPWICCRRNREELRDGRSEKTGFDSRGRFSKDTLIKSWFS